MSVIKKLRKLVASTGLFRAQVWAHLLTDEREANVLADHVKQNCQGKGRQNSLQTVEAVRRFLVGAATSPAVCLR